ncbi:MAG: calycin-like domain-containing protein [Tannerella sp.]|jgi:hypothetical protein|nr:calycin-like domain-containing protein [Tannerella sp.]
MKMKFFCITVLSVLLGSGFASCSKDNESEDFSRTVAGTYKGVLHIADMPDVENVTIGITRENVNKVTLKMKEIVLGLPIDISCESIVLSNSQDISGVTTYHMPTEVGTVSGVTTYEMSPGTTVPVPVTIKGTIKSGAADLTIQVAIPNAPVVVVFDGKKQ